MKALFLTGASVGSDATTPSRLAAGLGAALTGLPSSYGAKLSKNIDDLVGVSLKGSVDGERPSTITEPGLNVTARRLGSTNVANATVESGGTSALLSEACSSPGSVDASVAVLGTYPRGGPTNGSLLKSDALRGFTR